MGSSSYLLHVVVSADPSTLQPRRNGGVTMATPGPQPHQPAKQLGEEDAPIRHPSSWPLIRLAQSRNGPVRIQLRNLVAGG